MRRPRVLAYRTGIESDRWLAEFDKLPIKPEVKALIIKENEVKLR